MRYLAHGLDIESPIELSPYLNRYARTSGTPDILVSVVSEDESVKLTPKESHGLIEFSDGIRLYVTSGNLIRIVPGAPSQLSLLAPYIVGPALNTALIQRGALVLHSSAVNVGGNGHLFLGGAKTGKSEIALSYVETGSVLLSDEFCSVTSDLKITAPGPCFDLRFMESSSKNSNANQYKEPVILSQVIVLEKSTDSRVDLSRIDSIRKKIESIAAHIIDSSVIVSHKERSRIMKICANIAMSCCIYKLTYGAITPTQDTIDLMLDISQNG